MTIEVGGGGGGVFVPDFISGTIAIPSGQAAGRVFLLTPATGKRIKLTGLVGSSSNTAWMTLKKGGVTLFTGVALADGVGVASTNSYTIGSMDNGISLPQLILPPIMGAVDETIELIYDAVSTGSAVYIYEEGVIL